MTRGCLVFYIIVVFIVSSLNLVLAKTERSSGWCKFFYSKYILLLEANQNDDRLGDLLKVLKSRDCPQFEQECISRTFHFSAYTRLLYLRFCDLPAFNEICGDKWEVTTEYLNQTTSNSLLARIVSQNTKNATKNYFHSPGSGVPPRDTPENADAIRNQLLDPCYQVSLPFTENSGEQKYVEIKEIQIPFCDIIWCAIPSYALSTFKVSTSWCMPARCSVNLYIFMVFAGVLGCAILLANITVLLVFLTNKNSRMNSQKIYKMSIAVADLLVGLLVIPIMIETMRRTFLLPRKIDGVGMLHRKITSEAYSDTLIKLAGFFTSLSITVSIYTLMVASVDRLQVVFRPLKYDQFRAISTAKILVVVVWVCAILFSILPFVVDDLYPAPLASMIVVMQGEISPVLYSVLLGVPLVIVWCTNIATFVMFKKNGQKTQHCRDEANLMRTLSVMVGVFTLCVVPAAIVVFCHMTMPTVWPGYPDIFEENKFWLIKSSVSIGTIFILSNSLWNFFIYNAQSPEFQTNFKSMYKRAMHVTSFHKKPSRHRRKSGSKSQEIPLNAFPLSQSSEAFHNQNLSKQHSEIFAENDLVEHEVNFIPCLAKH